MHTVDRTDAKVRARRSGRQQQLQQQHTASFLLAAIARMRSISHFLSRPSPDPRSNTSHQADRPF